MVTIDPRTSENGEFLCNRGQKASIFLLSILTFLQGVIAW